MRPFLPILAAGGFFAAASVLGLFGGIVAAGRTGQPFLVPVGLMMGAAIGGYSALRLVLRSLE